MNSQILNMFGLAKRAGKFAGGHDAAFESIAKGKAKMCFLTTDASERLKEEFKETVRYKGRQVPLAVENPILMITNESPKSRDS